jgi:hypothetical protein
MNRRMTFIQHSNRLPVKLDCLSRDAVLTHPEIRPVTNAFLSGKNQGCVLQIRLNLANLVVMFTGYFFQVPFYRKTLFSLKRIAYFYPYK